MTGTQRFIALTQDDRRRMLQEAWEDAPDEANSLLQELKSKLASAREVQDQDLNTSSSNSHSATSNQPGHNTFTSAEHVRGWSQIIEGFRVARQYLQDCANYGLDAFTTQCNGFPSTLPSVVNPPLTLDTNSRWTRAASFYDVDATLIINKAVGDEAVYVWMLRNDNLLNIEHGVTETRGDYSNAIIGRTGGLVFG